jgi:hypothetical protein
MDLGVHITLTSEWRSFRWAPITPAERVRSLVDETGNFWPTSAAFSKLADAEELEIEVRAQVRFAKDHGLRISHIDSHMAALYQRPDLTACMLRVAREFSIPVVLPPRLGVNRRSSSLEAVSPDGIYELSPQTPEHLWSKYYESILRSIRPGVYELVVHPGVNNGELQRITSGQIEWGSAWRQRDLNAITDLQLRQILVEQEIHAVSWADFVEMLRL